MTEAIVQCVVPDEVSMVMFDAAIKALLPYDEFKWNKYFEAIQILDRHNWATCMENDELADLIKRDVEWWLTFWAKPDAKEIIAANSQEPELGGVIYRMQEAWDDQDYEIAGGLYGEMWGLLIGMPENKE